MKRFQSLATILLFVLALLLNGQVLSEINLTAVAAVGNWHTELVDASCETAYISLAFDANDHPHIAYKDMTNKDLKYAYHDGTGWQVETVHSQNDTGAFASIAIDSSGRPHIAWLYYTPSYSLMYAYHDGSTWQIQTVHSGTWPKGITLKLDSNDRPHIAYFRDTSDHLTYVWHDGASWHTDLIGPSSYHGISHSLALDSQDHPHIIYNQASKDALEYAWYDGAWQIETVQKDGERYGIVRMALDANDQPHFVHLDHHVGIVEYFWSDGSAWHVETIANSAVYIAWPNIDLKLDPSDNPRAVYSDKDGEDYVFRYVYKEEGTWHTETVARGYSPALALDSANSPFIAYYDNADQELRYASRIVNQPPTANAGGPYSGDEGSAISLSGATASDPDGDTLTFAWSVDSILCNFSDASALNPALTCDDDGSYVATLTVSDGINDPVSSDATVTVNNVAPTVDAGSDQAVFRNDVVTVSGTWTDPAGSIDNLYNWSWDLDGDSVPDDTGSASFGDTVVETTSFPLEGLYTLTFAVTDKDGDTGSDSLVVEVLNQPPVCSNATPSNDTLWPPNHQFVAIDILGVTDPEGDTITITIDSIFQDEPVDAPGSGNTSPDGRGIDTATAEVRAERAGGGNGRVYHISFAASDGHSGSCSGEVIVGVPKSQGKKGAPVDDGPLYDSTVVIP